MAVRRYVIFSLFTRAYLEGAFLHYRLKTWLEVSDLAEFLIFFTKKAPDDIATFRLKIGRSYAVLQPFKATSCWNLNLLFWRQSKRRCTFELVCLPHENSILKFEFFDDFPTYGRAHTLISAELLQLQIGRFKKKLWPSEDKSFSHFLCAHTWEEPFCIIV